MNTADFTISLTSWELYIITELVSAYAKETKNKELMRLEKYLKEQSDRSVKC